MSESTDANEYLVTMDPEIQEIIPGYVETKKQEASSLDESLSKNDFESLRIFGHSMKGSGAGYGFPRLTEIGAEMEVASKAKDREKLGKNIRDLKLYLERLKLQSVQKA